MEEKPTPMSIGMTYVSDGVLPGDTALRTRRPAMEPKVFWL